MAEVYFKLVYTAHQNWPPRFHWSLWFWLIWTWRLFWFLYCLLQNWQTTAGAVTCLLMICFMRSALLLLSLLQTAQLKTWLPWSTTMAVTLSSYLKSEHNSTVLMDFVERGFFYWQVCEIEIDHKYPNIDHHVSTDLCDSDWYELEGCFGFCNVCHRTGRRRQGRTRVYWWYDGPGLSCCYWSCHTPHRTGGSPRLPRERALCRRVGNLHNQDEESLFQPWDKDYDMIIIYHVQIISYQWFGYNVSLAMFASHMFSHCISGFRDEATKLTRNSWILNVLRLDMISGIWDVGFEMFLTDKTLILSPILSQHCKNEGVEVGIFTWKSQRFRK